MDVEAELAPGGSGIFEVAVDGKVVAARKGWDFPSNEEIVDAVARALGPDRA